MLNFYIVSSQFFLTIIFGDCRCFLLVDLEFLLAYYVRMCSDGVTKKETSPTLFRTMFTIVEFFDSILNCSNSQDAKKIALNRKYILSINFLCT